MILFYLCLFIFIAIISYFWVKGIDYMHKHHSDYKGEDLFNEKPKDLNDSSKE